MRILIAFFTWVVFLGSMSLYVTLRPEAETRKISQPEVRTVNRIYGLRLTATFAMGPDPFAVQPDVDTVPPSLLIRLNGSEILRKTEPVDPMEPITIDEIEKVLEQENEIYFEASPAGDHSFYPNALRLQVILDSYPVAEQTFWSQPGNTISGVLRFTPVQSEEDTDHAKH